jgi:hypothetical protein
MSMEVSNTDVEQRRCRLETIDSLRHSHFDDLPISALACATTGAGFARWTCEGPKKVFCYAEYKGLPAWSMLGGTLEYLNLRSSIACLTTEENNLELSRTFDMYLDHG